MESLFRLSDLEQRFPVNLNVLDARGTPGVMGLKAVLQAFLDHRREVLVRRANHRLGKIEARLHILDGLLIVYLDLDEVIRIVRYEEEPKTRLIERFELTDIQAEAILNTRLRQLARLEEMEIRREHAELSEEREGVQAMLGSDRMQWTLVGAGLREVRKTLNHPRPGDQRRPSGVLGRSTFEEAPQIDPAAAVESMVPREPITVILSERGWIRAQKGKVDDPSELKFKEGDKLAFLLPAETTDKLLIFASDGRFFTLACDKLPSGRGQGEPVRLMIELDDHVGIQAIFAHRPGRKLVLASRAGYGFVLPEEEAIDSKRGGKQVLTIDASNPKTGGAAFCLEASGDHLAVIGDNGKALIFPLAELLEMARGKGVKLQGYREGGLRDGLVFAEADGPAWIDSAGRSRAWPEWRSWLGRRASAGRLAPRGFPASKRFRPG